MLIRYSGPAPTLPAMQVPGWAGGSGDSFQPWHSAAFSDAAELGVELLFQHDDVEVPEVGGPFAVLSEQFFLLETEHSFVTPDRHSLLVLPHYRFYTDPHWATPIPVAAMTDADWWPNRLSVLFRMPPPGYRSVFRRGEPYAQAVLVKRGELRLAEMTAEERERKEAIGLHTGNSATREWVTADGRRLNNLYEVLRSLERRGRLPAEVRPRPKYRLV